MQGGYPTSYRQANGGASSRGYQSATISSLMFPHQPDNLPAVQDNFNDSLGERTRKNLARQRAIKRQMGFKLSLGAGSRFGHPLTRALNAGKTLTEIAEAYLYPTNDQVTLSNGWLKYQDCGISSTRGPIQTVHSCGPPWEIASVPDGLLETPTAYYAGFFRETGGGYGLASTMWILTKPATPGEGPQVKNSVAAYSATSSAVMADPMAQPIGKFMPTPMPIPWHLLSKRRQETSQRGYAVSQAWKGAVKTGGWTFEISATDTGTGPRTGTGSVRYKPPNHKVKTRTSRTSKEKKYVMALNRGSVLGRIVGVAGEAGDFITAIYEALDYKCKKKMGTGSGTDGFVTMTDKATQLFLHMDCIDMDKAVKNLIANEIEDRVIGKIGKVGGKANAANPYGTGKGFMVGPAL